MQYHRPIAIISDQYAFVVPSGRYPATFAEVQNAIADDYDTEIAVLNIAKDDEVEMQTECLIIWPCIQDYGQMVAKIRRLLAVKPSPRPELSAKVDNGEAP